MNKLRSKQRSDLEFDEALGFYLPTNKPKQQPVKPVTKATTFSIIPNNIANRLAKQSSNEVDYSSPVIYPFVVIKIFRFLFAF
jgi:hypothetical protein